MRKVFKREKGITLVAMIITIIVILILAGVTISQLTQTGLFSNVQRAKNKHVISQEQEILYLVLTEMQYDINNNKYVQKEARNSTKIASLKKVIKVAETENNQIQDMSEIIAERIQKNHNEQAGVVQDEDDKSLYIVTFNKTNDIFYMHIKDGTVNYQGTLTAEDTNIELEEADIVFAQTPTGWTNGTVTTAISAGKIEGKENFTVQYSKDNKTWTNYTGEIESTKNETIYARIRHKTTGQIKAYATSNIIRIDKTNPEITTALNVTNSTTNSKTVGIGATDSTSGIAKIEWYIKEENGTWRHEDAEYETINGATQGETTKTETHTFNNLSQNKNYYFYAVVYDVAGNTINSNTEDNPLNGESTLTVAELDITVTNENDWKKSKTVTITARNNNYTNIRYTTDGTNPTATTGTEITSGDSFTIDTNNTVIKAIAYDNTNQIGLVATATIINIDTVDPTSVTVTAGTVTTTSIQVTANATDADETSTSGKSNISEYRFKIDDGNYSNWQTSNSYTFTGLSAGTSHSIVAEAKDTAGNIKTSSATQISTIYTYTIAFNGNGSTGGSTASLSMTQGTSKNLTANGFSRKGYDFKGWNTAANGTGTSYTNQQSVNLTSSQGATITLYAQWVVKTYNVGDTVTIKNKNGVNQSFYVIEDSNSSKSDVKLLAAMNVNTSTNLQASGINPIAFDTSSNYTNVYASASIKGYVDSYANTLNITVNEKRLMLLSEVEALGGSSSNSSTSGCTGTKAFVNATNYWLGTPNPYYSDMIWAVNGTMTDQCPALYPYHGFDDDWNYGLRPVIVVTKTNI